MTDRLNLELGEQVVFVTPYGDGVFMITSAGRILLMQSEYDMEQRKAFWVVEHVTFKDKELQ